MFSPEDKNICIMTIVMQITGQLFGIVSRTSHSRSGVTCIPTSTIILTPHRPHTRRSRTKQKRASSRKRKIREREPQMCFFFKFNSCFYADSFLYYSRPFFFESHLLSFVPVVNHMVDIIEAGNLQLRVLPLICHLRNRASQLLSVAHSVTQSGVAGSSSSLVEGF